MEYDVTFGDPYAAHISKTHIEQSDYSIGDPIQLHFEAGDREFTTIAKASSMEDYDPHDHAISLFYLIAAAPEEFPEYITENFQEYIKPNSVETDVNDYKISLEGSEEVFEYLHDIIRIVRDIMQSNEVVIGNGHLDFLDPSVSFTPMNTLQSPMTYTTNDLPCVSEEAPELIEISSYDGEINDPEQVMFCMQRLRLEGETERLDEYIGSIEYFQANTDYGLPHPEILVHGPITNQEFGDDEIIRVSSDIEHLVVDTLVSQDHQAIRDNISEFSDRISESLPDEYEFEHDEQEETVHLSKGHFDVYIEYGEMFQIDILHAMTEQFHEIMGILGPIVKDYIPNFDTSSAYQNYTSNISTQQSEWVLDTNVLYRHRSKKGPDPITDLILGNPTIVGKTIKIPLEVICEINKHKDTSTELNNLSETGTTNLVILRMLSNHDFFDLQITQPDPEATRSLSGDGSTDISIAKQVSDEGCLVTDDSRLIDICRSMNIEVEPLSNISGPAPLEEQDEEILSEIVSKLEEGPLNLEDVKELIPEPTNSQGISHTDKVFSNEGEIIDALDSHDKAIKSIRDGKIVYSKTKSVDVVPTFSVVDSITPNLVDTDGEKWIPFELLESIRRGIGGLSTEELPWLKFKVPESYAYQSQQVNQINKMYKLSQIENAEYESITVEHSEDRDLDELAIRGANQNDYVIICDDQSDRIYKLGSLLGAKMYKVEV